MVDHEKTNARASRELAYSYYTLGEILMADGNNPGALENFRKALTMMKPMANQDPENVMLSSDVAFNTVNVGRGLVAMGRVEQGLPLLREGIRLYDQLAKMDHPDAPIGQSFGYVWQAEALARSGNLREATESDRKAVSVLEAAAQRDSPPDQPMLCSLAASYLKLGTILRSVGNRQEAEVAFRKTLELMEPLKKEALKKEGPANPRVSYILADTYFGLGQLSEQAAMHAQSNHAEQVRQWQQAREWYPGATNLEGFLCGNPSRTVAALSSAEKSLKQIQ